MDKPADSTGAPAGVVTLKFVPPTTLFFGDRAATGMKVKYLRFTHPQPVARDTTEVRPAAQAAMA